MPKIFPGSWQNQFSLKDSDHCNLFFLAACKARLSLRTLKDFCRFFFQDFVWSDFSSFPQFHVPAGKLRMFRIRHLIDFAAEKTKVWMCASGYFALPLPKSELLGKRCAIIFGGFAMVTCTGSTRQAKGKFLFESFFLAHERRLRLGNRGGRFTVLLFCISEVLT